jgi:hypothetical protein
VSYYVYENWRARGHRAMIHIGTCGNCNHGKGKTTGTRADNGKWHGPFQSIGKAKGAIAGLTPSQCRCTQ